jgi:hypothetical protein
MGEFLRDAAMIVLIAAGGFLLAYLIWVAATSKSFLAISLTSLVTAAVALVLVVAVLAVIGVLAWWAALTIAAVGSGAAFLALYPTAVFGFSRLKTQLKEASPGHWREGEASGKMAVEGLTAQLGSEDEAKRVRKELARLAEEAHVKQHHDDPEHGCLAFSMAFSDAFWEALRSSDMAPDGYRRPASGHFGWARKRT